MALNPIEANYFVDESGQPELFMRRGRPIPVGKHPHSRFFYVGVLYDDDPDELHRDLRRIRREYISDRYFKNYRMMRPEEKKTFCYLHAVDDPHEVRYAVYSYLRDRDGLRFFAILRDKKILQNVELAKRAEDPNHKYHPMDIYDSMLTTLMKRQVVTSNLYRIRFAERQNEARETAFRQALVRAQWNFAGTYGKQVASRLEIHSQQPSEHGGLQAVDYFLWALQRAYEMREAAHIEYLWHHVRVIIDEDDKREKAYGKYYNKRNPLDQRTINLRPY